MLNILAQTGENISENGTTINGYFAIPILITFIVLLIASFALFFTLRSQIRFRFKLLICLATLIISAIIIALTFWQYFALV